MPRNQRNPDFVCVGAMRSGTTTLWHELGAHPQIFLPDTKELHFFDRHFDKGMAYYSAFFQAAAPHQVCGEITPAYMFFETARRRLHAALPDAKIIVILRDPVQRAWSHYRFSVLRGIENLSFAKAIETEKQRLALSDQNRVQFSYTERGKYADQLEALHALYGSQKVYTIFLDELKSQRRNVLEGLQSFLSLDMVFPPSAGKFIANKGRKYPTYPALHYHTKKLLRLQGGAVQRRAIRKLARGVNAWNLADRIPELPENISALLRQKFDPYDTRLEALVDRAVPWKT